MKQSIKRVQKKTQSMHINKAAGTLLEGVTDAWAKLECVFYFETRTKAYQGPMATTNHSELESSGCDWFTKGTRCHPTHHSENAITIVPNHP